MFSLCKWNWGALLLFFPPLQPTIKSLINYSTRTNCWLTGVCVPVHARVCVVQVHTMLWGLNVFNKNSNTSFYAAYKSYWIVLYFTCKMQSFLWELEYTAKTNYEEGPHKTLCVLGLGDRILSSYSIKVIKSP